MRGSKVIPLGKLDYYCKRDRDPPSGADRSSDKGF